MESHARSASLRVERRLGHASEDVWEALTDEEQARAWMPTPYTTIDGHVDGQIEMAAPLHVTGRILAWDPPRLFEHEFRLAPCKAAPVGEDAVVRYEIEPDKGGCVLTVTLTRMTPATLRAFSGGLPKGLELLERYLDSRKRGPT